MQDFDMFNPKVHKPSRVLEVRRSSIEGVGTFAKCDIPARYILGEVKGKRHDARKYDSDTCVFLDWRVIEPNDKGVPVHHMNHSCAPNCVPENDINNADRLLVLTTRPIRQGEELTIDYAWPAFNVENVLQCQCGADDCRGWVVGPDDVRPIREIISLRQGFTSTFMPSTGLSPIAGMGVFAPISYRTHEVVAELTGTFVNTPKASATSVLQFPYGKKRFMLYDEKKRGWPWNLLNHSCVPNTVFNVFQGRGYLQAIHPIAQGEEFTLDYKWDPMRFPCTCGKALCRYR